MTDNDDLRERAKATLDRITATVEAHPPAEKLVPALREENARLQQRVERLEVVETAAIHMRERMIAARNFLAIGSPDDANRHLREGIEFFDIDPDCRAALGDANRD